jgi:hypothetical protein
MAHLIYEGPSLIDGSPIFVGATFDSKNVKTGNMVQTFILRSDMDPVSASRTGADYAICGNCVHRGVAHDRPTGQAERRSCYVTLIHGPRAVYEQYRRDRMVDARDQIAELGRGKLIRIGAYGDGAAVPRRIWEDRKSVV